MERYKEAKAGWRIPSEVDDSADASAWKVMPGPHQNYVPLNVDSDCAGLNARERQAGDRREVKRLSDLLIANGATEEFIFCLVRDQAAYCQPKENSGVGAAREEKRRKGGGASSGRWPGPSEPLTR